MLDKQDRRRTALTVAVRTQLLLGLLGVGGIGLGIVVWLMQPAPKVSGLLISSYAYGKAVSSYAEMFKIPALIFFVIVMAYATTELYKIYRTSSDPETYRRNKSANAPIRGRRKSERQAKQKAARKDKPSISDLTDLSIRQSGRTSTRTSTRKAARAAARS